MGPGGHRGAVRGMEARSCPPKTPPLRPEPPAEPKGGTLTGHRPAQNRPQGPAAAAAPPAAARGQAMGGEEAEAAGPAPGPGGCFKRLDAAFHCASSSYQMTSLYRYGELKDCNPAFRAFYQCVVSGTTFADPAPAAPEEMPCIWKLRTKAEAAEAWRAEFGAGEGGGA